MRPKRHETTGSRDLFRARLDQIINMKHELAQLAGKIDWEWIDREIAPLYSDKGRPGIETRFANGLLLLKHIYGYPMKPFASAGLRSVFPALHRRRVLSDPSARVETHAGASGSATSWSFSWPRACGLRMSRGRYAPATSSG